MAMYGSVVPLMQDLKLFLSSFHRIFAFDECSGLHEFLRNVRSLYASISLMDSLLRDSTGESYYDPELISQLENRITGVVHRAGSCVDLGICDYLKNPRLRQLAVQLESETFLNTRKRKKFTIRIVTSGLQQINVEIDCIIEELKKIFNNRDRAPQNMVEDTGSSTAGKSLTLLNPPQRSKHEGGKLVGLENDLVKMLDCLTGLPLKLQVFAVIGMAGIGKTTFTRHLYDHPLVKHHFYVRAWVTISQQYQVKEMLLGLLSCVTHLSDEMYESSHEQLREHVYKSFKGKRYLIILDDMWDDKVWDDLRIIFPDDKNGSRIMLTSRLTNVAVNVSQDTPPHHLRYLSLDESWELLCSKIFVNQSCPQELVKMGKQIACKCQGLPLAIVVVGGLLSKMNKTLKVWEEVAQSVGSLVLKDDQRCENILSLSYNHLPDPLKTCFLYLGLFPEDYEIPAQKLIWLWVAEGFIQPTKQKKLEEVAEDYLEDLNARSLVMVKRKGSNGRIKICCIHDLMRDLCLRKSQNNNFLGVMNSHGKLPLRNQHDLLKMYPAIENHRQAIKTNKHYLQRISFHTGVLHHMNSRPPFQSTRSCFCFETLKLADLGGWINRSFKLLKSVGYDACTSICNTKGDIRLSSFAIPGTYHPKFRR